MLRIIGWTLLILIVLGFVGLPIAAAIVGTGLAVVGAMASALFGTVGAFANMGHGMMPWNFHYRFDLGDFVRLLILIAIVAVIVRAISASRRCASPPGFAHRAADRAHRGYCHVVSRARTARQRLEKAEQRAFGETTEAERMREMEKGLERMAQRLEALETILLDERERHRD